MNTFLEGYECLEYKDYANAYQIFKDLYQKVNNNVEVQFNLGLCYIELKDYSKALPLFENAYQLLQQEFRHYSIRNEDYRKLQKKSTECKDILVPIREGYSSKYANQVRIRILQIVLKEFTEILNDNQKLKYKNLLYKEYV